VFETNFDFRRLGDTSNIIRFTLRDRLTGEGITGLSSASSGLKIGTICDNESAPTNYTAAASTIESIATLGTYAAPTATKCRFREVDSTNNPGLYELQLANSRYAVSGAKNLDITICGASNLIQHEYKIHFYVMSKLQRYFSLALRGGSEVPTDLSTELGEINQDYGGGVVAYSPTAIPTSDAISIDGSTTAAVRLKQMFSSARLITVDSATFTPTTTAFETDQTTNDQNRYTEQVLFGLDGNNVGVTAAITGYAFTNSKVKLTVETLPIAPSNGHRFLIMGRIEQ
jgi:hypothetical protein